MLKTQLLLTTFLILMLCNVIAQDEAGNEAYLINAAEEIISENKYCVLITLDSTGHPQARTMETLPLEDGFVSWFGTNTNSRKIREIKNDPRVTIYYGDHSEDGYVVLHGIATIVNDSVEKENHWQDHWDQFYPDRESIFVLIKVVTEQLEVVSYKRGLTGESATWRAPNIFISKPE